MVSLAEDLVDCLLYPNPDFDFRFHVAAKFIYKSFGRLELFQPPVFLLNNIFHFRIMHMLERGGFI